MGSAIWRLIGQSGLDGQERSFHHIGTYGWAFRKPTQLLRRFVFVEKHGLKEGADGQEDAHFLPLLECGDFTPLPFQCPHCLGCHVKWNEERSKTLDQVVKDKVKDKDKVKEEPMEWIEEEPLDHTAKMEPEEEPMDERLHLYCSNCDHSLLVIRPADVLQLKKKRSNTYHGRKQVVSGWPGT